MSKARAKAKRVLEVSILKRTGFFAEDKDEAAKIREELIRPALRGGSPVVLNFANVLGATQSFIHALIAGVIREDGIGVLDAIEFKACNSSVQGIIRIVVEYCQLDVADDEGEARPEPANDATDQ